MGLRSVTGARVGQCSLSAWTGEPDRCRWCDLPCNVDLEWCSVACQDAQQANHEWSHAHAVVMSRDLERCVDCGRGPSSAIELRLLLRAFIPMSPVESAALWRSEEWLAVQLAASVDVVHRDPMSADYRSGCHNHLDGLVTLCRTCEEQQRRIALYRAG